MFIEINTRDANDLGVLTGPIVWVEGPEGGKVKVDGDGHGTLSKAAWQFIAIPLWRATWKALILRTDIRRGLTLMFLG